MTEISRRDLLISFLGLPAALSSCSSRTDRLPDGEIVGGSDGAGHRLMRQPPPRPQDDQWERTGVVIVGGGVAGLTAAWRFARAGFRDFLLLELETAPGGVSRCGTSPLVDFPWGAHYLPVPLRENRSLIQLLEEMNLVEDYDSDGDPVIAEQFLCRDPQERIYYRGQWYEGLYLSDGATAEDLNQLAIFNREIDRWVEWRDAQGRRAFALPMSTGSDDAEVTALDKISMADWLDRHGLTSPRLRWVVDYACRDDYGTKMEQTSAWAGVFYFAARKREAGAKSRPYITWPEGNGRLIRHLYDAAQSQVRLGWTVADISETEDSSEPGVEVVAFNTTSGDMRGFRAGHVIFAAPYFLTRYLLRSYRIDAPRHLDEFEYGAWMVANLFLHDRPTGVGFPLAWDNVFYESPSLGYVTATHQRGLDYGPTILTYYYALCDANPRKARSRLLELDWASWADVTLTDISQAHADIRSLVDRLDVMRWGHAMIRPHVGFIWGGARQAASRPQGNIHFAHSDLSGLPLFEEAFAHGVRAADDILQARRGEEDPGT